MSNRFADRGMNRKDGIIIVDKESGPSSSRVVETIKGLVGAKKVGHAGTLDPFASGVLIILLNQGTKLSPFVMAQDKIYRAALRLGIETDTQDITGRIIKTRNIGNLDQRTRLAKALSAAESALVSALGGDLSPQELILVDRIVYKLARITLFEIATLTGKGRTEDTDKIYLAWSNSLRLDLQALGLKRRQKEVAELTTYIREAYSEKK